MPAGLITINVEEADDAKREQIRHAMREPYRTLLGHFRHEVGHYYWDRLIWDSKWLEPFRQLFGDERASYAEALKRNYEQGPPADWALSYISSYATMHPWEDWAETWAHYMHVVDSLATAMGFGLDAEDIEGDIEPFGPDALYAPDDPNATRFLDAAQWLAGDDHGPQRDGAQHGAAGLLSVRDVEACGGQAAVRADGRH